MKNFDNLEFIKIKILSSKGTVGNDKTSHKWKKNLQKTYLIRNVIQNV